jgi:hypothetical protein
MDCTTLGSREKSSFLRRSTWACGATWLNPFRTARAKSGAGIWKAKLADQSGELGLVLERVDTRDDAASTVTEQEDGQAGLARFRQLHEAVYVAGVVTDVLDPETLTVGLAAAAQVQCVHGKAAGHELFGYPQVLTAVGVDAVDDGDNSARFSLRSP